MSGCLSKHYETIEFDTLGELKAELGPRLLYPTAMPANFMPNEVNFTGIRYFETHTWEYRIGYRNSSIDEDEGRYKIPPGKFEINVIGVTCYEPLHPAPTNTADYLNSSRHQIEQHEMKLIDIHPDLVLYIEGVDATVYYRQVYGLTAEGETPYWYMTANAEFMHAGVLYMVDISHYAHESADVEEFKEYGRKLAVLMIKGLLSS